MKKVLVVSPHPDDAELAMGGTIAKMVENGVEILVVDLTDGEPTPMGSKEKRAAEAEKAADILGIRRICLGLTNRKLQVDLASRERLAEQIRIFQPDILFGPAVPDLHPDHREANILTEYARFDAKLCKTAMSGEPWWVKKYYQYYSVHRCDLIKPEAVVDISDCWEAKLNSILAYQSQVGHVSPSNNGIGIVEKVSAVNGYFGSLVGVDWAEGFCCSGPLLLEF